jgi:1,4-dihydroxy-2-naphthoyl-CoA hydrolase
MFYKRTIRLSDTDAAGVVYFAHLLSICHEAYEEALENAGIPLKTLLDIKLTVIPIVHGEIDFYRPLFCGDRIIVKLNPKILSQDSFEITYEIQSTPKEEHLFAKAKTQHVCINPTTRKRVEIPELIKTWLA